MISPPSPCWKPPFTAGHGAPGIKLSEADLFARETVDSADYFATIKSNLEEKKPDAKSAMRDIDSGFIERDLAFALEHSVATGDTVSWRHLERRYRAYQKKQQKLLASKLESCDLPDAPGALGKAVKNATATLQLADNGLHQVSQDFAALGERGPKARIFRHF